MAAGRSPPERREVVLPEVLARKGGIGIGDEVIIRRQAFKVVGLSRGNYSMANALAFMHASDLASLFDTVADASYLLVWPAPGVAAGELVERLHAALPGASVLERDVFIANDRALALQMGADLIRIMTVVAGLIAALIIGFTVFTFVARRARELAVARGGWRARRAAARGGARPGSCPGPAGIHRRRGPGRDLEPDLSRVRSRRDHPLLDRERVTSGCRRRRGGRPRRAAARVAGHARSNPTLVFSS